jgi:hypothetical protein
MRVAVLGPVVSPRRLAAWGLDGPSGTHAPAIGTPANSGDLTYVTHEFVLFEEAAIVHLHGVP